MKIFQIGFNKCGTKSLHYFFEQNGYNSFHWKDKKGRKLDDVLYNNHSKGINLLETCEDFTFFCDSNFIQRHFELLEMSFPDAKFIFNIRPVKDWLVSRFNHAGGVTKNYYMKTYNTPENEIVKFWEVEWKLHEMRVRNYFQGQKKKKLLIYNIMIDNGQTISNFLPNLSFTNLKFPHAHKSHR